MHSATITSLTALVLLLCICLAQAEGQYCDSATGACGAALCRLTPAEGPFVRLSVVAAVMNRLEHLKVSLPTWLAMEGVDEIVIVDWTSEVPLHTLTTELPELADPKVRIIRVEGQKKYILSHANNLAIKASRGHYIMKVDSDTKVLRADLLASHPLKPNTAYRGNWKQARDPNEMHLNGVFIVPRLAITGVHLFDERIQVSHLWKGLNGK